MRKSIRDFHSVLRDSLIRGLFIGPPRLERETRIHESPVRVLTGTTTANLEKLTCSPANHIGGRMNNVEHRDSNLHPTRQEALPEHYATDAGPLPGRSYAADKPHASHLSWHVTSWHYRLPHPHITPLVLTPLFLQPVPLLRPILYYDTCIRHDLQGRWCTDDESPGRVEMVYGQGHHTGLVRRSRQCRVLSEGCYN